MKDNGRVTFVSGYSPVIYEMIMTGKTGLDLVMEKLNSERYAVISGVSTGKGQENCHFPVN